eukprot:10619866-Alexandrium_andersonii.AAC.1
MSAQRARFAGDGDEIAEIIAPFALVPDFLRYSENHEAPLQLQKLLPHAPMFRALRAAAPNLAFPQSHAERIMLQ